jgi:hypothetical protein
MSRSTNEKDSSSCEPKHSSLDSTKSDKSDIVESSVSSEDVYLHPLITDYDVGMVVEGPPPLQACNSCYHFKFVRKEIDKHLGVCQVSLPIINEDLIFQDLDSSCWNFCLREDLLKLKIERLRSQNGISCNRLHRQ